MTKEESKALKEFTADFSKDRKEDKIKNVLTWEEFADNEIKDNPDYHIKIYEPLHLARMEHFDDVYYFVNDNEKGEIENLEEFKNFYVENRFTVRDAEIQGNLDIGEWLKNATDKEIEDFAKTVKRHKSFLIECREVFKKWDDFEDSLESQYTKEKSWRDLVKLAGIEGEKRPRKSLKKIIEERKKAYEERGIENIYMQGKLDEDIDLLKEA